MHEFNTVFVDQIEGPRSTDRVTNACLHDQTLIFLVNFIKQAQRQEYKAGYV